MRILSCVLMMFFVLACGDDGGATPDAPDPGGAKWQLLGERRPSSLLAVWAGGPDDVWVVGGREGTGGAPAVFRFDGTAWTKLDTGMINVDIWQVFGFAGGPVFLGGSNGTILRYQNGAFEKLTTPTTDIVFGIWGPTPDDVWAVGGQTAGAGFVWRLQGDAFVAAPGLPGELANTTVWKVVGNGPTDVWMSMSRGLVMHWDGTAFSTEMIGGSGESLFSIGCHAARCVSAGTNLTNGVLYEYAGNGWTSEVPTEDGPVWRGVTPEGEHRYVVGQFGAVLRDDNGTWVSDAHGLTQETFHAAWSDADGNVFAVGGKFDRPITIDGVLLYKGKRELPPLP